MMSDLISRSALLKSYDIAKMVEYDETGCGVTRIAIPVQVIKDAPAVDAVPVVHAEWIHDINNLYGCSACLGRETMSHKKMKRFCPNCGAQMDAKEDENAAD